MKRFIILLTAVFLLFTCFGCSNSAVTDSSPVATNSPAGGIGGGSGGGDDAEPEEDDGTEPEEDDGTVSDEAEFGVYGPGDPIGPEEYELIDWNLGAYSKCFYAISGEAVIYYWDGGETILGYFPGTLMLVDSAAGESVTVDLDTGYTSEGHGDMRMPSFGAGVSAEDTLSSVQTLIFSEEMLFEGQDVRVYTAEVTGGTADYYVSTPAMVCIGWKYSSAEGSVTYVLGDFSFEDVVDDILEENSEEPEEASEDGLDFSDTDGDGFSDWNEDRRPTSDELHELAELWKSEGMSQTEYLKRATELSFDT